MAYLLSMSDRASTLGGGEGVLAALFHKIIGIYRLHCFTKLRFFCSHRIFLSVADSLCGA